jgi:hypothetical protein
VLLLLDDRCLSLDLRPRQADVIERQGHRARRGVERIATPFKVGAQGVVALVHQAAKRFTPAAA